MIMDSMVSNSTVLLGGGAKAPVGRSSCALLAPIACSLNQKNQRNKVVLFKSPAGPSSTKLLVVASPNSSKLPVTCAAAGGGAVKQIDETQFSDTVLKSERPVLVEFVANWCGPCRLISPAMEAIAKEYSDKLLVVKIDHDQNPKLIEKFKVYGLPTLILFKNGEAVPESRREGAITKVKLKEYVDGLLDSISVA